MKWLCIWIMLIATSLHAEENLEGDTLAGENEAPQSLDREISAEPDEVDSISLTRTAAPINPTFKLPEFVITGGGVGKAWSRRPRLDFKADSSGGLKAKPSEMQAGKDQIEALGHKQGPRAITETARPAYGQAEVSYGLRDSLLADVFYGQELGSLYYLVRGDWDSSDGGDTRPGAFSLSEYSRQGAGLLLGWQPVLGHRFEFSGEGGWRNRLNPWDPLPASRIERSRAAGNVTWAWQQKAQRDLKARLSWDQGRVLAPGEGTSRTEHNAGLSVSLGIPGPAQVRIEGGIDVAYRKEEALKILPLGLRETVPGRVWLISRFQPGRDSSLSLGLALDSFSGDIEAVKLSPQIHWDQRMGRAWSLFADFDPAMKLPSLSRDLFDLDPVLSSVILQPEKEQLRLRAGLRARYQEKITVETAAFVVQTVDQIVMDDPLYTGLWAPINAGKARRFGGELRMSQSFGSSFNQELKLSAQKAELVGLDAPWPGQSDWKGEFKLSWHPPSSPWRAWTSVAGRGRSAGRLKKDPWANEADFVKAWVDISARLDYQVNESLSLLVKVENIIGNRMEDFAGYPGVNPGVGAGAVIRF